MRSVNLDNLPGEMYGDINILYEYVQQIFRGDWPTGFFLSAGPLYQYLIIPILSVVGTNFLGFKIASVITSLGVVAMTYLFVRELANRHLAVLSAFITGVSSWLLVYSRLGNLQVFVPLLVVTALFFAVRTVRHNRWGDAVAGGVVAGLGLYVYPPSFILAPVILVALVLVRWTGTGIKYRSIALFAAAAAVTGALFVRIVAKDPGNFFSGYIGGKIQSDQSTAQVLWQNVQRSVGAFHVRGDVSFRGNPPLLPHLDVLSGILMVVGLGWWIVGPRRRWSPLLIVPFVLIQVPAMLVLSAPQDVPSVSRTLGIAPLAYIFAATGLWWLVGLLRRIPWLPRLITAAALAAILLLNTQRYFTLYAQGLPHRNTPFAKIITRYLDALPADTHPYIAYCDGAPDDPTRVIGCGWGQASQPEPKSIQFDGQGVARTITELQPKDVTCEGLRALPKPAIILWRPDAPVPSAAISACSELLKPELHTAPNGVQVFNSSFIAP